MRALRLALLLLALLPAAAQAKPNVLVITTDDQTVADLQNMPETRALIGAKGVTFDKSVVSLSQCCPSRTTFLTGQYAHNHRVLTTQPPFGGFPAYEDDEGLPVWLQRAGYRTALVGKYLNGYGKDDPAYVPPGWDDWHVLEGPSVYQFYGFAINENGAVRRYPNWYSTNLLTRISTDVIRRSARDAKPFFLWTTYVAPHVGTPNAIGDVRGLETTVPNPLFALAFAAAKLPRGPAYNEADVSDKPAVIRDRRKIGPGLFGRIQRAWRQRQQALQSVDAGVVQLIRTLRETKQLDDTYVIFTSDNGFMEGQHRVPGGKVLPYEPSIRVPLLLRGPGVPAGQRRDQLVWNGDLTPTITEVTGAKPTWAFDGESLLPFVRDADRESPRDVLLEGIPVSKVDPRPTFLGLRTPDSTYVEHATGERELYDLRRDPGQLENLANTPEAADEVRALHERLGRLRDCRGAGCR